MQLIPFQATIIQEMIHVIAHSFGFTITIQEQITKKKSAPWDNLANAFLPMPAIVLITDNLQRLWLAEIEKALEKNSYWKPD